MNESEKLNYIPFGLTSCFPPLLFNFFPSCLHTALEGQHLGQDGHELCVQCPPQSDCSHHVAIVQLADIQASARGIRRSGMLNTGCSCQLLTAMPQYHAKLSKHITTAVFLPL